MRGACGKYTIARMKPRDLTKKNWDVNVAVFEAPGFDAQVTYGCTKMWFRVSAGELFADVMMPIREFKKAVDFIEKFDFSMLTDEHSEDGLKLGTCSVEIFSRVGSFKKGKYVKNKTPVTVLIAPAGRRGNYNIAIRLSLFKKMIRWYNSDI